MYCDAHDCRNNNDGYCESINYITINSNAYCDDYEPKFDNEEE